MRDKSWDRKVVFMSSVVEASRLVRQIAEPYQIGDTVKRQIDRAARRIPFWAHSRVRDAWYSKPRMRVDADELAQLRLLIERSDEARQARDEYAELANRIARLEAALTFSDAQFHQPQIDALRRGAARVGGVDRSLDKNS